MEDRNLRRQATLQDVLRGAPEAFFNALFFEARAKPSYEGVLAAIALGQTGVLGIAREALAALRVHWTSLVPAGSAPRVRGTHSTRQLMQAAREAGLPTGGQRRDLLARLPRGCPPRLYPLVRQWANTSRSELVWEVVEEINSAASNPPSDAALQPVLCYQTGRIQFYQAYFAPFCVPQEYLKGERGLNHVVGSYKRPWYKTADVAKVAFAYHGSKLSDAHKQGIEAAVQEAQDAVEKEIEAIHVRKERARQDKEAMNRMKPLVVALSSYFKQPRVTNHWALEYYGKRVSEAYAYESKAYKAPIQIEDAVQANREAFWCKHHLPNVLRVAEERFSKEHFLNEEDYWTAVHAGKAGRGEHAMILVSILGPRRAENLIGAPEEVKAAAARRRELDAALSNILEDDTSKLRLPKGGIPTFKDAGLHMLGLFLAQIPATEDGRPPTLEQALSATHLPESGGPSNS